MESEIEIELANIQNILLNMAKCPDVRKVYSKGREPYTDFHWYNQMLQNTHLSKSFLYTVFFDEEIFRIMKTKVYGHPPNPPAFIDTVIGSGQEDKITNVFLQASTSISYLSNALQVAIAMAKIQVAIAQFKQIPNVSFIEFITCNIRLILEKPDYNLFGSQISSPHLADLMVEEFLSRVTPPPQDAPVPSAIGADYTNTYTTRLNEYQLHRENIQKLIVESRLKYHLRFFVESKLQMFQLNLDCSLSEAFNAIISPILKEMIFSLSGQISTALPGLLDGISGNFKDYDRTVRATCGGI